MRRYFKKTHGKPRTRGVGRPPRRLLRLQEWFCRTITTPESRYDRVVKDADAMLTAGPDDSARDRLLVYVRDYWARCIDSLHEDFPGVAHVLRLPVFRAWMERYVAAYPSHSYTLRDLGSRLPDFMRRRYHGPNRKLILDMIRFEQAKLEAFDRGAAAAFDPVELEARQIARLPETRLEFQPHVILLRLDYPVFELIDRLRSRKSARRRLKLPAKNPCYTVVYRRDGVVYHREIEKSFYVLLDELQRGVSLARACESSTQRLNRRDIASLEKNAQAWFHLAVANRWLCAPRGGKRHEVSVFSEADEFSLQNRLVAAPPGPARHGISHVPQRQRQTARSR